MLAQERLDALWDFADPAASEARLRDAATDAESAVLRAELETQVARALGLQERFAEADAVLDGIQSAIPVVGVRVALERGRLRNSSGDAVAAIAAFHAAAALAEEEGHEFLRVDALHMLAIADAERRDEWTAEALAVLDCVVSARTLRWRVALHSNAGWDRFDAGRFDDALAEFELARAAAVQWGTPQQVVFADEALAECRAAMS